MPQAMKVQLTRPIVGWLNPDRFQVSLYHSGNHFDSGHIEDRRCRQFPGKQSP
ncbi:MAG TPA: hypothetical protein PKB02_06590 [Anaerohalosphaeraceae bacterium]|nr:hypothetical protein [Anaerohalosphaeraceae bacterium]